MSELYNLTMEEIKSGNFKRMPDMHVMSCSLKVLCTTDGCAGIEKLRLSCGGHGYLSSANFGNIYGNAVAAYTYEGENTVLLLQVGRSLMKSWNKYVSGVPISPGFAYFKQSDVVPKWDGSWSTILRVFQYTAAQ